MAKNVPGKATLTLAQISRNSRTLTERKLRATRGKNTLEFTIDCWISAIVVEDALKAQGWSVTEVVEE